MMAAETARSRFLKVMRGERPSDRLPVMEWASWWDQTIARWRTDGLPDGIAAGDLKAYLGLDQDWQHWFTQFLPDAPGRPTEHGRGWIADEAGYEALLPYLYPAPTTHLDEGKLREAARRQKAGEIVVWVTLEGFFWWPRVLFGIEPHLFAFYDQAGLMHRINAGQAEYMRRCLAAFTAYCVPDFMTFAEDMSYNHGPMIGKALFDKFMAPYYRQIIPYLRELGVVPIIDSDGMVEPLIPWFAEVGIEGILPLERMAGVDVNRIRTCHPCWKMMGGFDKTVMHLGEARMRAEFERLLPAMRSGCYIPSVDHQTPPEVSLEDYRLYLELFREYARRACRAYRRPPGRRESAGTGRVGSPDR